MVELRQRRYRIEWTSEGNQKWWDCLGFGDMAHERDMPRAMVESKNPVNTEYGMAKPEYVRRRYSFSVNKSGVLRVRKRG